MALSTKPYKGTRDFYPDDMRIQKWMFSVMREVARVFGYREYDGPMLESFDLYAAKSGEELVQKQLYWFEDRGDRKVAMRPEMTPTLARMVANQLNELPKPIRWYSIPNLWRYERPQRGRLREHWQLNMDVLGGDTDLADTEIIQFAVELMNQFGGKDKIKVRVNNRRLMDHFFGQELGLKGEVAVALTKVIDAKEKMDADAYRAKLEELGLAADAQKKLDDLFNLDINQVAQKFSCPGVEELQNLFRLLQESGVHQQVEFDPTIMRGLDYYTGTVFEVYDVSPENNRAMFGGGRYDNLVGLFGKQGLSGVGFGMGDVTLRNFLETHGLMPDLGPKVDVFVSMGEKSMRNHTEFAARELRRIGLRVITPLKAGKFGDQLKMAAKQGARFAVLFGEDEFKAGNVVLKDLEKREQETVPLKDLGAKVLQKQGNNIWML